jgi:glycosyltransferase involved in cell wall biosynthesis
VTRPWVVLRGGPGLRWGGDLRRRYLFDALIERTGALTVESAVTSHDSEAVAQMLRSLRPSGQFWRARPLVVSSEIVDRGVVNVIKRGGTPFAVDLHDDPIAFSTAVGLAPAEDSRRATAASWESTIAAFPTLIFPTESMARYCGVDPVRTIIAPNGTDTSHIRPLPPPEQPTIGLASGAGPGRGIETLIEASRIVRQGTPELRLLLWLVATGPGSKLYLDSLRERLSRETWIQLATVPYAGLPLALGQASVLCIPHPPNAYLDTIFPIKLADYMAAGRPIVVTPRTETARIVRAYESGVVATGDGIEDLAQALRGPLADAAEARRLGAKGRQAAVDHFDWHVIGEGLADALLERAPS